MMEIMLTKFPKNKKYLKKMASKPASYFHPSNSEKLRTVLETYLYHAFHAKLFVVSDDEQNHNIKFRDKLIILQSFIDLKNMGIPSHLFEFAVYSTAVEGRSLRRSELVI